MGSTDNEVDRRKEAFVLEWKKLGEIADIGTGSNNREDACDNGLYPFFVRSQEVLRINTYLYDEEAILIPGEGGVGDIFHYINGKYGLHQRTYRVHPASNAVLGKYIYYYLFENFKSYINQKSFKSTAASIRKPMLLDFQIAVPSFDEQTRIVGILDTFTTAIDNLKQQIAERRKQYEHYRDQLLDFSENEIIEKLSFGHDFTLKARIGWQGLTKKEYRVEGEYKLITGTDFTSNNRIDFNRCVYVDKERYDQDPYIQIHEDDVLITKDGTLGKIAYIEKLEQPATLNGGVFVVRDNQQRIIQKFLMYYLTSDNFVNWMKQNHTQGSIQHLTQALLSKFIIPVVSKEKQKRIVEILDAFSTSITNLEQQLKLHEKQYEYYRNKLLTFE